MLLLIIPIICPIFFFSKQIFCYKFLNFYESQSLQIFIHTESGQVYCGTENTQIYFALFRLFSISHSNVMHREICDKYFLGTIVCRILYRNLVQVL